MSWMKRPKGNAVSPPGTDQPPYSAPQPYGAQQNIYTNYQSANPNTVQQEPQQYWQMPQQQQQPQPQPQYNPHYGQAYQSEYGANANQFYQQPTQYTQNYNQPTYPVQTTQQGYQQNYYQNQGVPQNFPPNQTKADNWEDNWDWGWEDSSKQGQRSAVQNAAQQLAPQLQSQPVFNNANVIEESFTTNDSWNWPVEDKKERVESSDPIALQSNSNKPATLPVQNTQVDDNSENVLNNKNHVSSISTGQSTSDVKTLNDRDIVKEHLPNLALGKRFHIDNLTPQWSIESQMSQESSDGPQTEGTYRSENQSRNSSKSSPGLNTDNSNFNYSQSGIDEIFNRNSEWTKQTTDESTPVAQTPGNNSIVESHDELSGSLQEMSISNSEYPAPDTYLSSNMVDYNDQSHQPPPSLSPVQLVHSSSNQPPTLSSSSYSVSASGGTQLSQVVPASLPIPPSTSSALPPPSQSAPLPHCPPSSLPPTNTAQSLNPFKNSGPFSHKNLTKLSASNPSVQAFSSQAPSSNLTSPSVVSMISQHNRIPVGFGANLETTPDNSERPDQPQVSTYRPLPVASQVPDNLEVAPQNDRNEYLQTAHLSSEDYGENTDFSHNIPPPGLRRMVVGQQEPEYTQNLPGDEPPPGLARMVPGQQNEAQTIYNQSNDNNYLDRQIDGQPMDNSGRPYRQAEGQQISDNFNPPSVRNSERRPIGLDRMVPGESSNEGYSQYQSNPYVSSNEHRVVTGVDHEYARTTESGHSDVREQIMDGSESTEQTLRNLSRNIMGARESSTDATPDFSTRPEEQQREIVMEGENLQDLSVISSGELTFSREQTLDGADETLNETSVDRKTDISEPLEQTLSNSRRQSLNLVNTSGDDSERDRLVKSSPRRDRHKSSRDREREKEGRYSRGDRKYERDSERRPGRDDRSERRERDRDESPDDRRARKAGRDSRGHDRDRELSPDSRRARRSHRSHRYETEDTDYYSDRERYHRRQREGSYTSKPPRHSERDSRRHHTSERHPDRHSERYERKYREIDPSNKYGNLRREREEHRKRVVTFSSDAKSSDSSRREEGEASPARDRDTAGSDDERDSRRRRRHNRNDNYYAGLETTESGDPFLLQRQYQYYEQLRRTDPAAYMQLYKRLMAGHHYGAGAIPGSERGSLQSGRSSAAGHKHDAYLGGWRAEPAPDAPHLADYSDRDLTTDASLNLQLEESTVRSERMTPFRYSTAHIKASIGSRHVVVVAAAYPVDGRPARVALGALPAARDHRDAPGPLHKGVSHKKSVIEYCERCSREAAAGGARDAGGRALVWALLALLLRQNGVVVGTDIAELLMKNTRDYEYNKYFSDDETRRESSVSSRDDEEGDVRETHSHHSAEQAPSEPSASEEAAAVDRLRELLTAGNRQEALEWAIKKRQWGHALLLSWYGDRRARALAAAAFVGALPPTDALHTLYSALAAAAPPATSAGGGDWRAHAAMLLANPTPRPDHDARTLLQLGDTLQARGLIYSAQFCYVAGGVPWAPHPQAPLQGPAGGAGATGGAGAPRLALLLADHRAHTFAHFATNEAIIATEIFEYAMSLNQDYVIKDFQVYKLIMATRLADAGLFERALAYTERAASALSPEHSPALHAAVNHLRDRLQYLDPSAGTPSAADGPDSGQPSPRHQWPHLAAYSTAPMSPQHASPVPAPPPALPATMNVSHLMNQQFQQPTPSYNEPAEETAEYQQQYYQPQEYRPEYTQPTQEYTQPIHEYTQPPQEYTQSSHEYAQPAPAPADDSYNYNYEEQHSYADHYNWQQDPQYGYGEAAATAEPGAEAGSSPTEPRPMITMPGTKPQPYDYEDDRPSSAQEHDNAASQPSKKTDKDGSKQPGGGSGGGGGGGGGGGWLGGILTRLSLRAPNQMILPDDKNPTIVWDPDNKRWRNLDGDEPAARPPPPPPAAQPSPPPASGVPPAAGGPPAAPGAPPSNIFKMQKSRHIKKSYVDVFNPGGAAPAPNPGAPPPPAPVVAPSGPPPAYFIPAPQPAHQVIELPLPFTPLPKPLRHKGGLYDPTAHDDSFRSGI